MKLRAPAIAVGLFLLTLLTFWPVVRCGFVNYDDPQYVCENPRVQGGLSWGNVGWAFATAHFANYHPVTWLSLMLDRAVFGSGAWGFHFTNVLLHALAAVVLFLVLHAATGSTWRCALAAAVFAVHPLRVESVAWVSERKDVLAALFGFSAIGAYLWYVKQPGWGRYCAVAGLFALSLLSKPSFLTLPALLVLIDFWPLKRDTTIFKSVREKVPLLAMSMTMAVIAMLAQRSGDAIGSLERFPISSRFANAIVSCVRYIGSMIWPRNLAVFYPQMHWSAAVVAGSLVAIAVMTALALRTRAARVGWLWYLIALLPMVGLVQVGAQSMADRYTYLPMVGLIVAVVWAMPKSRWSIAACAPVLVALCVMTRGQIAYWHDSVSLFEHAIAVTKDNHLAHNNLAFELTRLGRTYDAQRHYEEALRISPRYATAHNGLGALLAGQGDSAAAMTQYELALQSNPDYALAHRNLAGQLLAAGRADEARTHLERAVALRPDDAKAQELLAIELASRGRVREALPHFEQAVALNPADAQAQVNLGRALVEVGRANDALSCFDAALRAQPNLAEAHYHAGEALARLGRLEAAAEEFRAVLALDPADRSARGALEQVMAHLRSASAGGE